MLCSIMSGGEYLARLLVNQVKELVRIGKETVLKIISIFFTGAVLFCVSVVLYIAVYLYNISLISKTFHPTSLEYEPINMVRGLHTFPTANVVLALSGKEWETMVGQPYKILVQLDMPESIRNVDVGMFRVCLELMDWQKSILNKSCQSTSLRYKSSFRHSLITAVQTPLLIFGYAEEKQEVLVQHFSGFQEDPMRRVTGARIQIRSYHVDVHRVVLRIHLDVKGVRFFMLYWPVTSAVIGVITFFTVFVVALHLMRKLKEGLRLDLQGRSHCPPEQTEEPEAPIAASIEEKECLSAIPGTLAIENSNDPIKYEKQMKMYYLLQSGIDKFKAEQKKIEAELQMKR